MYTNTHISATFRGQPPNTFPHLLHHSERNGPTLPLFFSQEKPGWLTGSPLSGPAASWEPATSYRLIQQGEYLEFLDPKKQSCWTPPHGSLVEWEIYMVGYRPMLQVYIYNTHDGFFSRLGGMILILGWRLETHDSNFSNVWCRLERYLPGSSLVAARPDKGMSFDCYSVWAPIHWHFSRLMPYYMFLSYIYI